jgi:hypothetical protein
MKYRICKNRSRFAGKPIVVSDNDCDVCLIKLESKVLNLTNNCENELKRPNKQTQYIRIKWKSYTQVLMITLN